MSFDRTSYEARYGDILSYDELKRLVVHRADWTTIQKAMSRSDDQLVTRRTVFRWTAPIRKQLKEELTK